MAGVKAGHIHLCQVAGNTNCYTMIIWQVMLRSSEVLAVDSYTQLQPFNPFYPVSGSAAGAAASYP